MRAARPRRSRKPDASAPSPALEGAVDTLQLLRAAGIRTALVCDAGFTPGRIVRDFLDEHGLLEHLEFCAFSNEVGVPKPDPRSSTSRSRRSTPRPTHAAHVGDLLRTDVYGARSIGMKTVRITADRRRRRPRLLLGSRRRVRADTSAPTSARAAGRRRSTTRTRSSHRTATCPTPCAASAPTSSAEPAPRGRFGTGCPVRPSARPAPGRQSSTSRGRGLAVVREVRRREGGLQHEERPGSRVISMALRCGRARRRPISVRARLGLALAFHTSTSRPSGRRPGSPSPHSSCSAPGCWPGVFARRVHRERPGRRRPPRRRRGRHRQHPGARRRDLPPASCERPSGARAGSATSSGSRSAGGSPR